MRARSMLLVLPVMLILLMSAPGNSTTLDLSTGINGSLTGFGLPDDDWSLVSAPAGVATGAAIVVPLARASFIDLEPDARWIGPSLFAADTHSPEGIYSYQNVFQLSLSGVTDLRIDGFYAADNRIEGVYLNGSFLFGSPCVDVTCRDFEVKRSFLIDDDSLFVEGENTLRVDVNNQPGAATNPTSMVFEAHLNIEHSQTVPEPSTLALLCIGLAGVIAVKTRRQQATRP